MMGEKLAVLASRCVKGGVKERTARDFRDQLGLTGSERVELFKQFQLLKRFEQSFQ